MKRFAYLGSAAALAVFASGAIPAPGAETPRAASPVRATPSVAPVSATKPAVAAATDMSSRTLRVGAGADFASPSAAAAAARDGDTIEITAGDYRGDVATWNANRLKIVGTGGRPHVEADGRDAEGKAIWVVKGEDTTIENIEFSGARVPDRNGAAIRLEGRNLIVRNSYFHDNENGLLTGANPLSEVVIDHCEFARNGSGDGFSHNLYVGRVGKLTVRHSYLHRAIVGHNLKSRAAVNIISDNRIADENDGRSSYNVDFPNGGQVLLAFNVIQKGPSAENATLVSYGAEGLADGKNELIAKGNTFISQRPAGVRFIAFAPGVVAMNVNGNVFAGKGVLPDIAGVRTKNAVEADMPGNVNWKPEGFQ